MRILLITYPPKVYPPFKDEKSLKEAIERCEEPLGLLFIGSMVSRDHDVQILNMLFDRELEDALASFKPHLVGVTFVSLSTIYDGFDIVKRVKDWSPAIFTVVGGYCPSSSPELFNKEYIDAIVMCEGEITFKELVETVERGDDYRKIQGIAYKKEGDLVFTEPRPPLDSLDNLPLPDRKLYKKYYGKKGFLFYSKPAEWICSSRGCRYNCSFCGIYMKKPVRVQSAERVVEEIENTNAPIINFADNDFMVDEERAGRIVDLVKERGIKKEKYVFQTNARSIVRYPHIVAKWCEVGELLLSPRLEAVDEKYLRMLGKPFSIEEYNKTLEILYGLNLEIPITFTAFAEFDEADFKRVIDFVGGLKRNVTSTFTVFTPLPGSRSYKERRHELTTNDWRMFDLMHLVLPSRLPREKFYENCQMLNDATVQQMSQTVMSEMVENVDVDFLAEVGGTEEMLT